MDSTAALVFEDVSKTFAAGGLSVRALDHVSIKTRPGLVTGLIGPDSAGKTTLMRLATGLLLPDSGSIHALGIDVLQRPLEVQSSVGYMPQRFGLYEDLTVQENLDLYADLQGVARSDRPARYRELMRMTGLAPFTRRLAGRLSGGMKQKLGLACTLVQPPRLLLLDEPTVGVDPVSRRELWAIVYRQVRDEGMSVLLSTAYLDEAERCDDVILMHAGRRLGQGTPASFSEPMRGRSFHVTAPSLGKRSLQTRLSGVPGIVDAIIEGEQGGESLFLRKLVLGIPAQASGKNLTRPLMPSAPRTSCVRAASPHHRKLGAGYTALPQMTGRRFGCNSRSPLALRTTGIQNYLRLPGTTSLRVRSPWLAACVW